VKKLLVTGAGGFIGSYFIEKYKERYEINSFSFLKDDISSLDCRGAETVLHLSALVHQMGGASEAEYERVNVTQTLSLAKKAKEAGVGQFIFMSSVKVYGEESKTVYTESTSLNPQDAYGISKRKAEAELLKLGDESFQVSIVRTPIVYGYGVKANIQALVNLVKTSPVLPFAGINNRRSMVYIGNLCHLVDKVIEHDSFGVFLASDDEPLSTSQLIVFIAKSLGKKVYLIKVPFFEQLLKLFKPSFHKRLYGSLEVDNKYTKQQLNLTNPYGVEEGIKLMLQGEK